MRFKSFVYLLKVSDDIYKIGVSKNVNKRVKQLQTGNPDIIEIIETFPSQYPYKVESVLHRRYNYKNIHGECFKLDKKDIEDFKKYCLTCETNFKCLEDMENHYFI